MFHFVHYFILSYFEARYCIFRAHHLVTIADFIVGAVCFWSAVIDLSAGHIVAFLSLFFMFASEQPFLPLLAR